MVDGTDGRDGGKDREDDGRSDPPPDRGGYRWIDDVETQRVRLRQQVRLILETIPGARAHSPTDDLADVDYLYVEERLLVRDADLARVQEIVGGEVQPGVVNGLSVLAIGEPATDALDRIDERLGEGVATPEHIFYVCPVTHLCPADEPTPVDTSVPYPETWRLRPGAPGIAVTVIDTGLVEELTATHSWLEGVTGAPDPVVVDGVIGPYGGHGSFIAGVLRTVAPLADVYVDNVLNAAGAVTESDLIRALYRAMDRMPDVISMSAGAHTRNNVPALGFEVFWEQRQRHVKGTALVVAAGNDGARDAFWPAAFDWTVSVGAIDASGQRAPFSNFGSWVDVYALGVDLVNAFPDGTYDYHEPPRDGTSSSFPAAMARWSGTSFATPLVAGMIAARAAYTGQSGRLAARSILRIARAHSAAGVGAIADPTMAHSPEPPGV